MQWSHVWRSAAGAISNAHLQRVNGLFGLRLVAAQCSVGNQVSTSMGIRHKRAVYRQACR
jgi:hypothetical protein